MSDEATAPVGGVPGKGRHRGVPARIWPGVALTANQFVLMGANLLVSLLLAGSGGLGAVGAVAPAILVFQFGAGVLQQVIAEASLLAEGGSDRPLAISVCRWAVGVSLAAGAVSVAVAVAATATVPDGRPLLGILYAVGIPAAHGLDIGRAAAVAYHRPRPAAIEAVVWGAALVGVLGVAAYAGSPAWVCAGWAIVNWAFLIGAALVSPPRRPRWRGAWSWLRGQRRFAGAASLDSIVTGLTPLLTTQLAAMVTTAATVGAIRIVQQLFAPLAFVSISVRKFLIFKRRPDEPADNKAALRDGLLAAAWVTAGAVVLGGALFLVHSLVAALAFLPVGVVMVLAGVEKVAQGLGYGVSLSAFVRRDFRVLLRARYVFFGVSLAAVPLGAHYWGASGYLTAASLASTVFFVATLAFQRRAVVAYREPAVTADV